MAWEKLEIELEKGVLGCEESLWPVSSFQENEIFAGICFDGVVVVARDGV